MNMIGCKCLNIIIETEVTKFPIVEKEELELTIEESEDNFFQNGNLRQVKKLDNINKSLPGLVETREVGSWIIHYCINCKVHTHAVHKEKGASCVFINPNLLTSEAIRKLKYSENYSMAYNIVIDPSQFDDENEDTFYPNEIEPTVKVFKQVFKETMRKEEALVDEKIRKYTDDQYNMLDNLREKLINEEQTLIRTLASHILTKSTRDDNDNQDVFETEGPISSPLKGSPERRSSQSTPSSNSRHTPKRQKSTPVQKNYDAEFMFDFDGVDDTFVDKEDELESDTDDVQNVKSRTRTTSIKIAKSLPMDIPAFMKPRNTEDTDLEEDFPEEEDNVDIAASIKKLAKSVHGSGVFGDLPRPRFSTQL